jgi:hypothetical protein
MASSRKPKNFSLSTRIMRRLMPRTWDQAMARVADEMGMTVAELQLLLPPEKKRSVARNLESVDDRLFFF